MVVVVLLSAIVVLLIATFGLVLAVLRNDRKPVAGAVIPRAGFLLSVRSRPNLGTHSRQLMIDVGEGAPAPTLLTVERIGDAIVESPNLSKVVANSWSGTVLDLAGNLLSNPRIVDAVGARGGYYVVKAAPSVKWMVANGQRVAQASGKSGQAGARAVVVGGASMAIGAEVLGAAASTAAYNALVGRVEEAKFLSEMIHQRQMSEVLGLVDRADEIVRDLGLYAAPESWPAVVLSEAVRVGGLLLDQSAASDRLRAQLIETRQAKKVRVPKHVAMEFAVSYSTHTSAAQLLAARTLHASACGDFVTEYEMLRALQRTLDRLSAHHEMMLEMVDNDKWWSLLPFTPDERASYAKLVDTHQPIVDKLAGSGTAWLVGGPIDGRVVAARELSESEAKELTAGSAD